MQNFSEVMKLLKKAEVKEGEDNFQSDLDLIFDALEFPEKYTKSEAENNEQYKNLNLIDLAKKAKPASQYMCLKYYRNMLQSGRFLTSKEQQTVAVTERKMRTYIQNLRKIWKMAAMNPFPKMVKMFPKKILMKLSVLSPLRKLSAAVLEIRTVI